ncbi:MAG TPA: (d)CMP kinase, partial [Beutenbergiaceae bacterium]|nr:(d)CMP kinase [Beutenbergiaceae bacterium]
DHDATAALVQTIPWRISTDPKNPRFIVDDIDITTAIRTTEISAKVSDVARILEVRAWMKDQQRQIIHQSPQGIIAEGRDITTVVAPDADVRILLIADEQARLARRAKQLHGTDNGAAMAATLDQVARRDRDDSTVSNFLEAADGVVTIDSTELSLQDTIEAVRNLIV